MKDPFRARADAALQLVQSGQINPVDALTYVVWPTEAVKQASEQRTPPRRWTAIERQHALDLVDTGSSWAQAAAELGCAKATVGTWVRQRTRERRAGH